jgi:hypothetical protein
MTTRSLATLRNRDPPLIVGKKTPAEMFVSTGEDQHLMNC